MHPEPRDGCAGCALSKGRRAFLRDGLLAATAAFIALGASPATAFALPVEAIRARRRGMDSVKYPIPAADGAQIDKENQVILVRWQNMAYAFNLSCPHQNTALRWDEADHRFQCPKHHSKYQPDGIFISGRATRGMDRLAIQKDGEQLAVNLDLMFKQDEDAAAWTAAAVALTA